MNSINKNAHELPAYNLAGLATLAIRLVIGWTYFSAFWRRLFLANKLDPEVAGYIGEKFNHFLPNALGIKPIIEYLVSNPDMLWWAMAAFTIIEGIVGLLLMFGLFTRLMSIGVFGLAMGILLGSGWIGTTCLDEWQIGILGIAGGFVLFLTGSSHYSIDHWLYNKSHPITQKRWFRWIGSGVLPIPADKLKKFAFGGAMAILGISLFTNQYFHGGLWGTLHNKSVKPKVEIQHAEIQQNQLQFTVHRVEGVDVYGSFLIGISLTNAQGEKLIDYNGEQLAKLSTQQIENAYVAKVKPGAHSLIIPLGSKATINLNIPNQNQLKSGKYNLQLTDISGAQWTCEIEF